MRGWRLVRWMGSKEQSKPMIEMKTSKKSKRLADLWWT